MMILTKEIAKTYIGRLPTKETAKRPVRYLARFLDANHNVVQEFKSVSAEKSIDNVFSNLGWWNEPLCKSLALIPVVSKRVRKPVDVVDASAVAPAPRKKRKLVAETEKTPTSDISVLDSALDGYVVLDCLKNIPA